MGYVWDTYSPEVKVFICNIKRGIKGIIKENFVGFYIHGSLAMGGFNSNSSDIDVLVVTNKEMKVEIKRSLVQFLLKYSTSPFPIEISFLNRGQLKTWQHPCPFDFHYSESWRERYQNDLLQNTFKFINKESSGDADLAAHITITYHRGICVDGDLITKVFPIVPRSDYISSIMGDFEDCVQNIADEPIYCSLNMIRVFWYLKEGVISSKQEAGNWGQKILPQDLRTTINKALNIYTGEKEIPFSKNELFLFENYITKNVRELLQTII